MTFFVTSSTTDAYVFLVLAVHVLAFSFLVAMLALNHQLLSTAIFDRVAKCELILIPAQKSVAVSPQAIS